MPARTEPRPPQKYHSAERAIDLSAGQAFVVPRGVVHRTRAPERTIILMVENAGIIPTVQLRAKKPAKQPAKNAIAAIVHSQDRSGRAESRQP
jgi:mannose-6-phosphate isomerase-like protein (cupin superfamily)